MDAEARALAGEAMTYAWREHCGVKGRSDASWPADERIASDLLVSLEAQGYTIVPIAEYERLKARPQMRTVQERPPLTLDLGEEEATDA